MIKAPPNILLHLLQVHTEVVDGSKISKKQATIPRKKPGELSAHGDGLSPSQQADSKYVLVFTKGAGRPWRAWGP